MLLKDGKRIIKIDQRLKDLQGDNKNRSEAKKDLQEIIKIDQRLKDLQEDNVQQLKF